MFFLMIVLGILAFGFLFSFIFLGVPFMPTHRKQAETMMDLLGVGGGTVLVDLGSGAGRLLFTAAKRGARATGYELNPLLFAWTKLMIAVKGVRGQVDVKLVSLYDADVSNATAVSMFLFPPFMPKVEKKLLVECAPGTKLASYAFAFPNTKEDLKKEGIYVYAVPAKR